MEEKETLYIPVKIRKRKEHIQGIGGKELYQIAILVVIGAIVGIALHFIKGMDITFVFFPIALFGFAGYIFLKKNQYNQNTIDLLLLIIRFSKSQKIYKYKYHNIYEKTIIKKEDKNIANGKKRKNVSE